MPDILTGRFGEARVAGGGKAFVLRVHQELDVPGILRAGVPDEGHALVRRSVVDKDEFCVLKRLFHQRTGAALRKGGHFEDRNDDSDFRHAVFFF